MSLSAGTNSHERLYLEQISVSEDLPHTDVNAIAGDREGFIWFGTFSGLCRYDGIRMEVFNVTNSILKSSRIKSLYMSDDGMLYIGTETGGLSIYDTVSDRFVSTLTVPLNNVNAIFGYEGKICLCTDAGISILNFSDGNHTTDSHWLNSGVMGGCGVPGKGMVLCAPSGLYLADKNSRGGVEYAFRPLIKGIYCCSAILLEDGRRIFVGGYDGCYVVDSEDWSCEKVNSLETVSLYSASDGNIWVGTRKNGMVCYDQDFRIQHRYGPYEDYGFNSCDITSFYMDRSSVLWIGTIGNGCYKKIGHTDDFHLYSVTGGTS